MGKNRKGKQGDARNDRDDRDKRNARNNAFPQRGSHEWRTSATPKGHFIAFYTMLVEEYGMFEKEQWSDFLDAIRRPLPATWRVSFGTCKVFEG